MSPKSIKVNLEELMIAFPWLICAPFDLTTIEFIHYYARDENKSIVYIVTEKDQVYIRGSNILGHLATGDYEDANEAPIFNPRLSDKRIKQFVVGPYHSMALSSDGFHVYSWGSNYRGRLGIDFDDPFQLTPIKVEFNVEKQPKIKTITCSTHSSLAITRDSKVYVWGSGTAGQLAQEGIREDSDKPILVDIGYHSKGVKIVDAYSSSDEFFILTDLGHLLGWGMNRHGLIGCGCNAPQRASRKSVDPTLQGIDRPSLAKFPYQKGVKVSDFCATNEIAAAVTDDGSLWGWGYFLPRWSSTAPQPFLDSLSGGRPIRGVIPCLDGIAMLTDDRKCLNYLRERSDRLEEIPLDDDGNWLSSLIKQGPRNLTMIVEDAKDAKLDEIFENNNTQFNNSM